MALIRLNLPDQAIFEKCADLIADNQLKNNIQGLTPMLWTLAKFKFQSAKGNLYLEKACESFLTEDITPSFACRNLWNLYGLKYKSDAVLKRFTKLIVENP